MFFGGPKLVGTNADTPPYEVLEGRWIDHGDPKLREAVISNQSAEQMEIKLGEEVLVISGTKEYRLKIVGIVAQASSAPTIQRQSPTGRPMMSGPGATLGPAASALYVPMPLAEKITRQSGKVNLVNIKLREGASATEFQSRWLPQVAQAKPAVLLVGVGDLKGAMEEGMMAANAKKQAWAATGMSLLAALFIIFTTLSMGVHERVRQFAVMRAVGLTRFQVACVIAAESLVLALIGWGGGLAAGYGLADDCQQRQARSVQKRRIAGNVVRPADRCERFRRRFDSVDLSRMAGHERPALGSHVATPLGSAEHEVVGGGGRCGAVADRRQPVSGIRYAHRRRRPLRRLRGRRLHEHGDWDSCCSRHWPSLPRRPYLARGSPGWWDWSRDCSAPNSAAICGARWAPRWR